MLWPAHHDWHALIVDVDDDPDTERSRVLASETHAYSNCQVCAYAWLAKIDRTPNRKK